MAKGEYDVFLMDGMNTVATFHRVTSLAGVSKIIQHFEGMYKISIDECR